MSAIRTLLAAFLLFGSNVRAGEGPDFSRLPVERKAGSILVSCQAQGPARDISYRLALQQCRSMAADAIDGSGTFRSLVIGTEESLALHEEFQNATIVRELICLDEKQVTREEGLGFQTFLRCRFDTRSATARSAPDDSSGHEQNLSEGSLMAAHVQIQQTSIPAEGRYIQSVDRTLFLSTIPMAKDVLIVSSSGSRIVKLTENPTALTIRPGDRELIVRLQGFRPAHLRLQGRKNLDVYTVPESVEVQLER